MEGIAIVTAGDDSDGPPPARQAPWDIVDRRILEAPTHPLAKALLAYWQTKCPAGGVPSREAIAAADIPKLLPYLQILEPIDGGRDWMYRLVGTQLTARYSFDWTGQQVSKLYTPERAAWLIESSNDAIRGNDAGFAIGRLRIAGREHVVYEIVVLPIVGRDGASRWLLHGIFFHN
jgi:hypothetical protein